MGMRVRDVLRNVAVLCVAVGAGWWMKSAGSAVYAQRSGAGDSLGFQLVGNGPQQSLTVFNADNHTLYVYPQVTVGNSHISCEFSFTLGRLGGPIDRENCPVGELVR
jgi:hypothetical protein